MTKKDKKIFWLALIFFLLYMTASVVSAQERQLENKYPDIAGYKLDSASSIADFAIYIFNFAIFFIPGILAFGSLFFAGILYLSSSGDPKKITDAKNRILFSFLGIIILLSSYLILYIINPKLTLFKITQLEKPEATNTPLSTTSTQPSSDLLGRIKNLALLIKETFPKINQSADNLNNLVGKCDCNRTRSFCLCLGGKDCQGVVCYAGPALGGNKNLCNGDYSTGSHPCPDSQQIKDEQKNITDLRDMLLYYKNRAITEKEDLAQNIKLVIEEKIAYYKKRLADEKGILDQTGIDFINNKLAELNNEKSIKINLGNNLSSLIDAIEKINLPATELSGLPDKCLSDVTKICKPSCQSGGNYGCYKEDKLCGCQPLNCSGGNPCPVNEIKQKSDLMSSQNIPALCDAIIAIINQIK